MHLDRCTQCIGYLERQLDTSEIISEVRQSVLGSSAEQDQASSMPVSSTSTADERELLARLATRPSEVTRAAPVPTVRPKQVGKYRLLELIGRGSMGTVYRAIHVNLHSLAAVKLMAPERFGGNNAIKLFQRETLAVGRLAGHPHVVRALDADQTTDGFHYLAMDFVDGVNASQVVAATGPLSVADACEIVRQAALGIDYAHRHGLIHRDVKPSNLLIDRNGQVRVSDLGLVGFQASHRREEEIIVGTIDYMAPEQGSESRSVDHRADIYSLGCTLFKLLTGHAPYHGFEAGEERRTAHQEQPVRSLAEQFPDIDPHLDALVGRMMAKRPEARPASAAEISKQLEPWTGTHDLTDVVARSLPWVRQGAGLPVELPNPADGIFEAASPVSHYRRRIGQVALTFLVAALLIAWFATANSPDNSVAVVRYSQPVALPVNHGDSSAPVYLPDEDRLFVSSPDSDALFEFGTSTSTSYLVKTVISPHDTEGWPVLAGVFFDHQTVYPADGSSDHILQRVLLRRTTAPDGSQASLELVYHQVLIRLRDRLTDWRTSGEFIQPLELPPTAAPCQLEVHVRDRRVESIVVDDQRYDFAGVPEPALKVANSAGEVDHFGGYGVSLTKGIARFTATKFATRDDQAD